MSDADLEVLVGYLRTIGKEEPYAPVIPGTGTGLSAAYFANTSFAGSPKFTRVEAIDFAWGSASPDAPIPVDGWCVRWSGYIEAPFTGTYVLQTVADDGARVTLNGSVILDRLRIRSGAVTTTLAPINLVAGQRYPLVVEQQDFKGDSSFKLSWTTPGSPSPFVAVPAERLYTTGP